MAEQRVEAAGHDVTEDHALQAPLTVIVVVCLAPRQTQQWELQLPPGATVADALQACPSGSAWREVGKGTALCGIWGRVVEKTTVLQHQDRVEVYRALTVDPKLARRDRFHKQGARTAGLVAINHPGATPGY